MLTRWVLLAAVLVSTGAAAFHFLVLRRVGEAGPELPPAARLGSAAGLAALLAALARLPLQALELRDPLAPLMPQVRALVLHTWWGKVWAAQLAAAVAVITCYALVRRGTRGAWVSAAVAGVALALTLPLSGHAIATEQLTGLAVVADAGHVLGAGAWLGAMLVLAVALATAGSRGHLAGALVAAFSPLALTAAGTVLLTGVISAKFRLGAWSALWTSPYGVRLLVKLGGVALMAGCGAYNWRRAGPRLLRDGEAGPIRRSISIELVLGALVLIATAVLIASPLPGED